MKITIIGPAHPLRGGLASYNERIAKAYKDEGHEVNIITFSLQYPNFLFPGKTQYSSDAKPDLDISVAINSINPLNWISIGLKLKNERPDLIICKFWLPFMGPCFGTILRIAKSNGHTKVASIIDNIIPHEKRPGDRAFAKYFVGAVDGFVVMSKSVGQDMRQFTSDKAVEFIPHPIYDNYGERVTKTEAQQHLQLKPTDKHILFFGFIRKYKGLDLLLEAMADKRIQALGVKAIVAGEYYDEQQQYLDIIDQHDLHNHIILKDDFIPNDEVRYYFGASDVVVQPYKSATQSGISQLAFHFEKPMIVTNVGGLPEIVNNGVSGYVTAVDSNEIAEAILKYYNDNKEAEFTKAVIEKKKEFSWERMTAGVLRVCGLD
ncbi:MAG: glycosyltransferase [Saprospiraceae bacterium]|jgi:glycosyltransferase involved in cell wall biosynthesis